MDIKALLGDKYSDGMTVAELVAAMEGIDAPASDAETRLRKALTDSNKENKGQKDQIKALTEQVNALTRQNNLSAYTARFTADGYSAEAAVKAATALVDGNMDDFFAAQNEAITAMKQAEKVSDMRHMKVPGAGFGKQHSGGIDYAKKAEEAATPAERAYYIRLAQQQEKSD